MAFTALGVNAGFAWSINATVPVTTGADMLVPLRLKYGRYGVSIVPLRSISDRLAYNVLSRTLSDSIPTPGATRSGFALFPPAPGPRELNVATVSSERSDVPMWLDAPTVRTHGALPGAVTPPYCIRPSALRPRLPAAAVTTIPSRTTRLAASVSGSESYDSYTPAL